MDPDTEEIRFKGTPEGDGNFFLQVLFDSYHAQIRFKGTPEGDGNNQINPQCPIFHIRFKGTPEGDGNSFHITLCKICPLPYAWASPAWTETRFISRCVK